MAAADPGSTTQSRALSYASIAAFVVAAGLLLYWGLTYFLLLFLGILLALLLRAPANWLAARVRMPSWASLIAVGALLLVLLASAGYFFGSAIASQSFELGERVPQTVESLLERLRETEWGQRILRFFTASEGVSGEKVVGGALKAAGSTLGVIAHVVIVIFFAVFLAAQPELYVEGSVRLVPPAHRRRARQVLGQMGEVLERWLVGQAFLMLCIFALTLAGLLIVGMPLALPLALLAGLLNFIPYVGPILASVPAILVGFSEGTQMAVYAAAVFAVVQSIEGYLLEPLVQHRAVYLPPALILLGQVLLGLVGGPIGVIVATPFVAALVVAVRMLYVEDVLGDREAA